jgi:transposase
METVQMSGKELERYAIIKRVVAREVKQSFAATQLSLTVRQIKRLCAAYRQQGASGLVSKQRGVPSNRQSNPERRAHILTLVRQHYFDFGPLLACEYLKSVHGQSLSSETLRQWMVADGLWQPKLKRKKRSHPSRERRACKGELIQIDGSPHAWFEDRAPKCTLIAFIDDATSQLMGARFYPSETTIAYLDVLESYVSRFGRPLSLYSDRHSIFTKHKDEGIDPTQFERACLQLDIESILALSPQAKGRVERLFQTLQDRLLKALRLAGISDMDSANRYLESTYIAQHNERFAVQPKEANDAHRAYSGSATDLTRICARHHTRQLSSTLSCQFENQVIQIVPTQASTPKGRSKADIVQHRDGTLELLHEGKPLAIRVFKGLERAGARTVDDKTLNAHVDLLVSKAKRSKACSPMTRLAAQIAHEESQRKLGIYTPSHPSQLPRTNYKRKVRSKVIG